MLEHPQQVWYTSDQFLQNTKKHQVEISTKKMRIQCSIIYFRQYFTNQNVTLQTLINCEGTMINKITITNIVFLSCLLPSIALGRSGEVCFPFGSPDMPTVQPELAQGHPGKIGPPGMPGQKGQRGEIGSPGQCACNPNEIEELRSEFQLRVGKMSSDVV